MTHINKQKFLAELGQLLNFMYEDDKQTALSMYGEMFDNAEDEVALVQLLMSPTRQAVLVARSYHAKDHKLQVRSQVKGENAAAEAGTPAFVTMIENLRADAVEKQLVRALADENQLSLFEAAGDEAPAEEVPGLFAEKVPAEEAPVEAAPVEAPATAAATVAVPEEAAPADTAPAADDTEAEIPADPVEDFLHGFTLPPEVIGEPAAEEAPVTELLDAGAAAEEAAVPAETESLPEVREPRAPVTVRKPRVFLLVLFALVAIPLGVAGIALLAVPTLLCLAVAVVAIVCGVLAILAAFGGGFVVFADIMLVLGAALILLALGLMFLWLFIWFIGGAMAGLTGGLLALGQRWCYKEVSVNE